MSRGPDLGPGAPAPLLAVRGLEGSEHMGVSEALLVALGQVGRSRRLQGISGEWPAAYPERGLFHISCPSILFQVGCLPWAWSSSPNGSLVFLSSGGRSPVLPAPPCESAPHALLCGLVGTLPLAIFLRVSSLPKMILLSVLTASYILVLELSGYTKAVG